MALLRSRVRLNTGKRAAPLGRVWSQVLEFIFGLGNPGKKYAGTRHNVGFGVVAVLANRFDIRLRTKSKLQAALGDGIICGKKAALVEPLTYMNDSGYAVSAVLDYFDAGPEDAIVVYDDIDLPFGAVRIREKGSAGTHNGMRSVVSYLGTGDFVRVRLGIGKPEGRTPLVSYVLGKFPDQKQAQELFERGADAVECILRSGVAAAQNAFHTLPIQSEEADEAAAES